MSQNAAVCWLRVMFLSRRRKVCVGVAMWSTRALSTVMPELTVSPRVALVDEKVCIEARGLRPSQRVTLHASLKERAEFAACGHFTADQHGSINLTTQASCGGTYTGVDGMGLMWSMTPAPGESPTARLSKRDVAEPFSVHFSLLEGHLDLDHCDVSAIVTATAERWYKASSVRRIAVREGRLRGTLFLPAGDGPFPGVIDMFGSTGGLVETRAALLASHGFAALALGYLGYDDLTKNLEELDLDYFLDAVDWLQSHSAVYLTGIGVIGVSKGAELAMLMATFSPKVTAVVSISGAMAFTFSDLKRIGGDDIKGVELDVSRVVFTDAGVITRDAYPGWEHVTHPIWQSEARFLLLYGEDDQSWNVQGAKATVNSLPVEKRKKVEMKFYPGTGHLIEPPYTPHCYSSFHKVAGINLVWGGSPRPHAHAQEDAWHKTLDFLHLHLGQGQGQGPDQKGTSHMKSSL
ncbi:acyl-coenzyme A thioesterase 1-like isoform X1 [Haliotis rufescens]|uniref:acyl-coenzyme A thioesterase 1-like isoform X1 n=3 Tax=Haliotis rufescens TaxID=6454 RepID=UPI00201E8B55|nr:acyl-coenzyme A thioesterase 1-like isoform X1 [Haliotis rufescens]